MNKFGMFLVARGLARPEDIVNALSRQSELELPIGKLALEHDMLTMNQTFEILNHQADTHLDFGEVAIRLGCLNAQQVSKLLVLQRQSRPMIGEILVGMGVLSAEAMQQALKDFVEHEAEDVMPLAMDCVRGEA